MNKKQNFFGQQPSVVFGLTPVSASFAKAGGGEFGLKVL
jgi:hypothetical protein